VVETNIQEVTDRQWCIKWGARNYCVRDMLNGVVRVLGVFKEVASAAASLDPLHAGLPWAGVCFLLPLATGLSTQEEAAKVGLERVTQIIGQHATFFDVCFQFHDKSTSLPDEVGNLIIDLYSSILEYEVVAACFFQKTTLKRYGRAVPRIDDFKGLLEQIKSKESATQRALRQHKDLVDRKMMIEILNYTGRILGTLEDESGKKYRMLSWLSDIKYGQDHDNAQEKLGRSYLESGQWLFQSKEYRCWQSTSSRDNLLLWLRGHVGTGKTSMLSIAIQRYLRELQLSRLERVAYFYCSKKDVRSSTPVTILRCLACQLGWKNDGTSIADSIRSLYENADPISGAGLPGLEGCKELLTTLVRLCPKVTVIIDALDECSDPDVLLEALQNVCQGSSGNVKIFVSSRMQIGVQDWFSECLLLGMEQNREDVRAFIKSEMDLKRMNLLQGKRPDLEQRLASVLIRRSENV
jgi:hypothetical protein